MSIIAFMATSLTAIPYYGCPGMSASGVSRSEVWLLTQYPCRMWMLGPIQWINLIGWRKLQDFEVHAMFIYWRELSVMMGCKWVPDTLIELEDFRVVGLASLTISSQTIG